MASAHARAGARTCWCCTHAPCRLLRAAQIKAASVAAARTAVARAAARTAAAVPRTAAARAAVPRTAAARAVPRTAGPASQTLAAAGCRGLLQRRRGHCRRVRVAAQQGCVRACAQQQRERQKHTAQAHGRWRGANTRRHAWPTRAKKKKASADTDPPPRTLPRGPLVPTVADTLPKAWPPAVHSPVLQGTESLQLLDGEERVAAANANLVCKIGLDRSVAIVLESDLPRQRLRVRTWGFRARAGFVQCIQSEHDSVAAISVRSRECALLDCGSLLRAVQWASVQWWRQRQCVRCVCVCVCVCVFVVVGGGGGGGWCARVGGSGVV